MSDTRTSKCPVTSERTYSGMAKMLTPIPYGDQTVAKE